MMVIMAREDFMNEEMVHLVESTEDQEITNQEKDQAMVNRLVDSNDHLQDSEEDHI